ncbi:MAG: ATP-dependent DNA helicase RecG [Candidatus Symbiodolus clandestinus]
MLRVSMNDSNDQPILAHLPGIGPKTLTQLNKLGLRTIYDLLWHLPLRYQARRTCATIACLKPGLQAEVAARIVQHEVVSRRHIMLLLKLADTTGSLWIRFFRVTPAMKNRLTTGTWLKVYGEVQLGHRGIEMRHPEWSLNTELSNAASGQQLLPIYSSTQGLRQTTWRKLIEQALVWLRAQPDPAVELFPSVWLSQPITLLEALTQLHQPTDDSSSSTLGQREHPALQRLILEELLAHQLSRLQLKSTIQQRAADPFPPAPHSLKQQLLQALPFSLTAAQRRVIQEIECDLAQSTPMMRLVQGDVGSGKTLVAVLAALSVLAQGKQVALMAPTELLAEQHAEQFQKWLTSLGIPLVRITGSVTAQRRRQALAALATGEILLAVGTQALFQQHVAFHALGLVIIDEQHRFGVQQRLLLWKKGEQQGVYPHQLVMTATPIPRTLAMSLYADLACSTIDELPVGRQPIQTVVLPNNRRSEVVQRVSWVCSHEQRQVYWVCPLIEDSEFLEAEAAEQTAETLRQQLPQLIIGLVHGRMSAGDKLAVLQAFRAAEIQLLVATLVVEIGVDVPNASVMVIENAERLGLAQLHQLRGRVGRGVTASHCILLYKAPLTNSAKQRLAVLRDSQDGFAIAERDLQIRGPGELLGTRQTGDIPLRIADIIQDQALFSRIQQLAQQLHTQYPQQANALIERWLPQGAAYSNA